MTRLPTLVITVGLLALASEALAQTTMEEVPASTEPASTEEPPRAQFEPSFTWLVAWNMSLGAFDTFDFASDYSFRGASIEVRYSIRPDLSAGVSTAWHVLDEKEPDVTAQRGAVTLTGTQIRTANFVPILARLTYELDDFIGGEADVWAALGVGTYYIERQLEVGLFAREEDSWHFGLAPELGASLPVGPKTHAFFSTAWNFAFESGSISTQSYVNFNIGFMFL